MKKQRILYLFVLFVFIGACDPYRDQPDLKAARAFLDAYYVFADQNQALRLTKGVAEENIKKEIKLLEDMSNRTDAYRSRDVLFDLKKEDKTEGEHHFFFQLRIIIPQLGEQKRMVLVSVDRNDHKITYFSEIKKDP